MNSHPSQNGTRSRGTGTGTGTGTVRTGTPWFRPLVSSIPAVMIASLNRIIALLRASIEYIQRHFP